MFFLVSCYTLGTKRLKTGRYSAYSAIDLSGVLKAAYLNIQDEFTFGVYWFEIEKASGIYCGEFILVVNKTYIKNDLSIILSFNFFTWVTKLNVLHIVNLFVIDYESGVLGIKCFSFFKIICCCLVIFHRLVSKCPTKVSMCIFRLHLNHFVVIV